MAIVEKSEKKNPKQWEEFAVLRLSKRELAGLAALMAVDRLDKVTYRFYDQVNKLLGELNNYHEVDLNATYGEI